MYPIRFLSPCKSYISLFLHGRGPPLAELITLGLLLVDTAGKELGVVITRIIG